MQLSCLNLAVIGLASSNLAAASLTPNSTSTAQTTRPTVPSQSPVYKNPLPANLPSLFPPGNESYTKKTFIQLPKGLYNVSVGEYTHFPNRTVYIPLNTRREKIPILAWENGICYFYRRMYSDFLTEIASHGYLVIAPGTPYNLTKGFSNSQNMGRTIDLAQSWKAPGLYIRIDSRSIAAAGHSCGGMLTVSLAARDPRLSAIMVLNAEANITRYLDTITAPSLWIHGGKSDANVTLGVEKNFKYMKEKRKHLSVFKAVMQTGHMGTYWLPRGGAYAEAAVNWLDWHLKGEDKSRSYFAGGQKSGAAVRGWAIDSINV